MAISPVTKSRCRQLTIRPEGEFMLLEVFDPRINKIVTTYRARTAHDAERVKRHFMTSYRIPKECVTVQEVPNGDCGGECNSGRDATADGGGLPDTRTEPDQDLLPDSSVDTGAGEGEGVESGDVDGEEGPARD